MKEDIQKAIYELVLTGNSPDQEELIKLFFDLADFCGHKFPEYREIITAHHLGINYYGKKLGPDANVGNIRDVEIKGHGVPPAPPTAKLEKILSGGSNISDHTRERHENMLEQNHLIVESGFVGKIPVYIFGFSYNDPGFVYVMERKFENTDVNNNRKRSISWSLSDLRSVRNIKIFYKANLQEYGRYLSRQLLNFLNCRPVFEPTEENLLDESKFKPAGTYFWEMGF